MFTKIQRLDPLALVTLTEAKDQLNIIDFNDDDSHIRNLISTSSNLCEEYTNRLFSKCQVTGQFLANKVCVTLPYSPVINIVSVKVGEEDVAYDFDEFTEELTLTDTTVDPYAKIRVVYHAGFTNITAPEMVKHACKILISDFYANRESVSDKAVNDIPLSAVKILDAYKLILV